MPLRQSKSTRFRLYNQRRREKKFVQAMEPVIRALEDEIKRLRQHREWLFETTNRYQQRYRNAEQALATIQAERQAEFQAVQEVQGNFGLAVDSVSPNIRDHIGDFGHLKYDQI